MLQKLRSHPYAAALNAARRFEAGAPEAEIWRAASIYWRWRVYRKGVAVNAMEVR